MENQFKIKIIKNLFYDIDSKKSKEKIPFCTADIVEKYANKHDVDALLVAAIIKTENESKSFLFSINNPGCLLSEESNYQKPIVFDNLDNGIEHLCKMIKLVRDSQEIFNPEDITNLLRPTEPAWSEQVQKYYLKLIEMYRGK